MRRSYANGGRVARQRLSPLDDYRHGVDPQFSYFGPRSPNVIERGEGGPTGGGAAAAIRNLSRTSPVLARMLQQGSFTWSGPGLAGQAPKPASAPPLPRTVNALPSGYRPGVDPEFQYFADGGQVNKYQAGGVMQGLGAETPSPRPAQAQPQQNPIVMGAVAAIVGNHPEPQRAIQNFVQVYGQQAFAALRQQVIAQASADQRGGAGVASLIRGEGDGLTDDVPANIEGQEPVALSDGEVVVPADVVSGLGNGSSEAGAREIEKMNQDVRQARTGTETQPGAIDAETVLPRLG